MSETKVKSTLHMFKAEHGDAFHLEVTDGEKTTNIIIDSGSSWFISASGQACS
ncbi:MAG: hypothetical protein KBT06_08760 [Prevotellaceae bacterium]|nr:hypothetical protein [Candidatus Colivivens equi]